MIVSATSALPLTADCLSLQTCSPLELMEWLHTHRFAESPNELIDFVTSLHQSVLLRFPDAATTKATPTTTANLGSTIGSATAADATATVMSTPLSSLMEGNAVTTASIITPSQPRIIPGDYTVSCTVPRIKLSLSWYKNGICVREGTAADHHPPLVWIRQQVQYCILFPKPEDCIRHRGGGESKKSTTPTMMILFVFHDPIPWKGGKQLTQLCFTIPASPSSPTKSASSLPIQQQSENACMIHTHNAQEDEEDNDSSLIDSRHLKESSFETLSSVESWIRALRQSLVMTQSLCTGSTFRSHEERETSTTTGGLPFVQCHYGVHDGVLFPYPQGLLFYKPPLFIPFSQIDSIQYGGSQRYAQLQIQTTTTAAAASTTSGSSRSSSRSSTAIEDLSRDNQHDEHQRTVVTCQYIFANIHRSEISGLQLYLEKHIILSRKSRETNNPTNVNDDDKTDTDDEDEEEEENDNTDDNLDNNHDPSDIDKRMVSSRTGRVRRVASVRAEESNKRMKVQSDSEDEPDDDYMSNDDDDEDDELESHDDDKDGNDNDDDTMDDE